MFRTRMLQVFRLAALAAVVSLAFGSVAWAHDDDDYYYKLASTVIRMDTETV